MANEGQTWQPAGSGWMQSVGIEKDKYIEQIIKKKANAGGKGLKAISYVVLAFGIYAMFSSTLIGTFFVLLGAGMIYLSGLFSNLEYEYLFVNSECEISTIFNKSSRKQSFSFDGDELESLIKYSNEHFQNDLKIRKYAKVMNFTSGNKNESDNWYGFVVNKNSSKVVLLLELNEKTKAHALNAFKKKIQK